MNASVWLSLIRTLAVVRKEFLHIRRDPRTLAVMFLIPVVQLILLGYAATTDVEHLFTAVLDHDRTRQSRELLDAYRVSNYFDLVRYVRDEDELRRLIERGEVRAGLIIPAGYGQELLAGRQAQVSFVIDGSDPSVAQTAFSAAQAVGQALSARLVEERYHIDPARQPGVDVRPRVWYNPNMRSANFMIPGLIAVVLTLLTMMLTALAIVREREQGTLEQLIVTPIRPPELIIGKVVPYVVIAFFDLLEILAIGVFWFQVPVRGSVPLLLGLACLFVLSSLSLGLLISTLAGTQREAMLLSYFIFLPTIFLSGFFFPIEAMPAFLRFLSRLVPLTYILIITRGIILKGVGLPELNQAVAAVTLFGVTLLVLATARFRKRLS